MQKTTFRMDPAHASPVQIISDSLIAERGVDGGRLIPGILFPESQRPDLAEIARVHGYTPPGDVRSSWVKLNGWAATLILEFLSPMEATAIFEFNLIEKAGLVDKILASGSVYLMPGSVGETFGRNLGHKPALLIQIPKNEEFSKEWEKAIRKSAAARFKEYRLPKKKLKVVVENFIAEWRSLDMARFKSNQSE